MSRQTSAARNAAAAPDGSPRLPPQAFLAAIVDSTDDAIVTVTPDIFTVMSWNAAAERLYGYTAGEMIGNSAAILVPHPPPEDFPEFVRRLRAGKPVIQHETVRVRKDGTHVPVWMTATPLFDEDGGLIGWSNIARDRTAQVRAMTELRHRNTELQRSNRYLVSMAESALAGLRGPCRAIDWHAAALSGSYRPVLGEQGLRFLERIRAASERIVGVTGDMLRLARESGGETPPADSGVAVSGSSLSRSSEPVPRPPGHGQPDGPAGGAAPLPPRTPAPARIPTTAGERKALLAAIVSTSQDAIVGFSARGSAGVRIRSWNPGAERILGYQAAEIVGKPASVIAPPDRAGEASDIMAALAQGKRIVDFRTMRVHKNGTAIPMSMTSSPVLDGQGHVIGGATIGRDITGQVQIEADLKARSGQLEQANRVLEAFVSAVADDLLAPVRELAVLAATLLDLYRGKLDPAGLSDAERIQELSDDLVSFGNNLLRRSRASRTELDLVPVDLAAEMRVIASELRHSEPERAVRLEIRQPVWALADGDLIRIALRELLEIAWQLSKGSDEPVIEFGTTPAGYDAVCCFVRNNGGGIDTGEASDSFKLASEHQGMSGAGLTAGVLGFGLIVAGQIVERHGGLLWVTGTAGETLTVSFSLTAANPEPDTSPDAPGGPRT